MKKKLIEIEKGTSKMALLLLIILLPVIEITLFIQVGGAIGAMTTVLLTFVTAFVGLTMMKSQGMAQFSKLQTRVSNDKFPGLELISSVCVLTGGLLLLLPGFFTDSLGLLLLLPPFQKIVYSRLKAYPEAMMKRDFSGASFFSMQNEVYERQQRNASGKKQKTQIHTVIDAEYQKIDDDEADK